MDALTVGFDLDMTLLDTRPGIADVYRALAEETGVPIDVELAISRLGPPLAEEIGAWFPAERVPAMVARFRELYPALAVPAARPMAGARESVDAVHEAGGRVVVVSAKNQRHVGEHLRAVDLPVDVAIGDLWAEQKAVALREQGAAVYVGDHLGDVAGARAAGAVSVGVASGPIPADELAAAGADVVLPDLRGFPGWLGAWRAEVRASGCGDAGPARPAAAR